ncbi:phytoene desaturase family protein [Paenibacillus pinihumi]|uniref:phytoene desaturase family protein n=1 Tax=Paenibacillus pinihumi TaxID=669462 RepID=UPI0004900ED6|nr:phytoene desaturase family protein [Paenibacillus pinihumi]
MKIGIVGGGIGGMMTALLLAEQGRQTVIYERQESLGGRLAYEGDGLQYRIDRGPTIVLLPQMLKSLLAEAGIGESDCELLECDPLYNIHYADGKVLTKYRNPAQMAEELERVFPGEGAGVHRYLNELGELFEAGKAQFLQRSFVRKREFFSGRNLRLLGKLRVHLSARQLAARYFRQEQAIDAFSLQTLYVGGLPAGSPSLYTFIPYAEHAFGIWYLRGGYAGLSGLLAHRLTEAGVEVRTGAGGFVREIVTRQGKVQAIETHDGLRHLHSQVIFNGDFPYLPALLPSEKLQPRREYVPSSGSILLYIGADRRWGGEQHKDVETGKVLAHQFFLPPSLTSSLERLKSGQADTSGEVPAYYVFNPCALDAGAAPEGHSVLYVLIPMPLRSAAVDGKRTDEQWREIGERLAQRVLDDAEQRAFPGLRAAIRWKKLRTPADGEAEGWYRGGSFGIAPTWLQSGAFRPQMVPYHHLSGLYSVGASIHPGGGIPIVMQGAKLLADHLQSGG